MAVVEVLNSGYSKDKNMMHMLCSLFFISEHHHFLVEAVHLPGKLNEAADTISRNNISHLLQVLPGAQQHPIPIPGQALRMLVEDQPDRTSRNWTELFTACTRQAYHHLHKGPTWQEKRYLDFCSRVAISPLPVSETMLRRFIAFLRLEGLRHQTAKSYLSAVRHLQISHGFGDPRISTMPQLELVLRGMKRELAGQPAFPSLRQF